MPDPKSPVCPIRPPHRSSAESRIYVSTNESYRFVGHFGIRPLNKQVPFRTVVCSARSFCRVTQRAPNILKLYGSEFCPDKANLRQRREALVPLLRQDVLAGGGARVLGQGRRASS